MDQIQVVSRDAIPPIRSVDQDGELHSLGELRDFRWNDHLRDFMPAPSQFSVSWVRLDHGEVLQPHVHPIQSLMVFYAGSGEMLGDLCRPITAGDVVVVPAGRKHGFVGGPRGLHALSIQFGQGLYTTPEKPRVMFADAEQTLNGLLAYNEKRLGEFVRRPIFDLLADGTLDDPTKRNAYLEALQIWVDGNQTLLFSRQATCMDPRYVPVFLRHFKEEMGHDVLHKDRQGSAPPSAQPARDSIMEAITNWFTYQMYVLDNAEKTAIIHLVIENASSAYHRHARPALAKYVNDQYFDVHVDADAEHAAMGEALLRNESPRTYARLRRIVGEAWDMIGAMTDRVAEITRCA
jgi:mannose-6-phosphate isomerase-like protein (cupin superfamily)